MKLEYGRKILPHLFKRNNYATFMVGKSQPVGSTLGTRNQDGTDFYFIEGRVVKMLVKNGKII